jgi:opacity protein-like surface antigen
MRNSSILLAGVAAFLCTDIALAQSVVPNTGFYLGLGLGKSHARMKTEDLTAGNPAISESASTTDTGYKAFVGWSFSRYLAAELSYTSIGRYRYSYKLGNETSNVTYDANAVALSGLGTIPIGKDWSALLRLGVSANKAERSGLNGGMAGAPSVPSAQKTRASPMGGVGLQYDFTNNAALRLEFEYYGLFGESKGNGTVGTAGNFPDTTGRANIWMFSIGGVARF